MSAGQTILSELLGTIPQATFLNEFYLRQPFALNNACHQFSALGDRAALIRLLSASGVDAIAGRQGATYQGEYPTTSSEIDGVLDEGYTIGIRHAERHDPGLANLARRFHDAFAAAVNVHLYCTPASHPGFGWHYDAEEVFILQTEGRKEWWLRKNTVNPWPLLDAIPKDQRYEREIMPVMHCTLEAGDWLYVPSGYWHKTVASTTSISLSVGLQAPTALDIHDLLRSRLSASMLWRQRLPCGGQANPASDEELLAAYRAVIKDLRSDLDATLNDDQLIRSFLESQRVPEAPVGLSKSDDSNA